MNLKKIIFSTVIAQSFAFSSHALAEASTSVRICARVLNHATSLQSRPSQQDAQVLNELTLTTLKDLDFGVVFPGRGPTRIDFDSPMAAKFEILGTPNAEITGEAPAPFSFVLENAFDSRFKIRMLGTHLALDAVLDGQGVGHATLGGTLPAIPNDFPGGEYCGFATVSASYLQ